MSHQLSEIFPNANNVSQTVASIDVTIWIRGMKPSLPLKLSSHASFPRNFRLKLLYRYNYYHVNSVTQIMPFLNPDLSWQAFLAFWQLCECLAFQTVKTSYRTLPKFPSSAKSLSPDLWKVAGPGRAKQVCPARNWFAFSDEKQTRGQTRLQARELKSLMTFCGFFNWFASWV